MHAWFAAIILLAMLQLLLPRSDSADRVPGYIVISLLLSLVSAASFTF